MRSLGLWSPRAASPGDVVAHLTAMQAQEHAYALWSIGQRMKGNTTRSAVARAFDEGRFLRTHLLRPTWHFVSPADLTWLMVLTGPRVIARLARRYQELELDGKMLAQANDVIAAAVAAGPLTRHDLVAALERRGISTGGQRLPHMLMYAELSSVICSGPLRGKQHTYARFDERVPPVAGPRGEEAVAELALRYFTTRGPATLRDFGWWSGLPAATARRGLETAEPQLDSWTLDDRTYWFAGDAPAGRRPRIDLVQCYDEVIISYTQSRHVLRTPETAFEVPRHLHGFTHVVLAEGQLLGHWRPTAAGDGVRVAVRIAGPLDAHRRAALDEGIDRYRRFAEG